MKPIPLKYYGMCSPSALNGTKYDSKIDDAIIFVLSNSDPLPTGELKRRIENILDRSVPSRTYYIHLELMIQDGLLCRNDTGKRGTKDTVSYSLSEAAKKSKS